LFQPQKIHVLDIKKLYLKTPKNLVSDVKQTCFKDPENHNPAPKKVQALKPINSSNLKCSIFSIASSFSSTMCSSISKKDQGDNEQHEDDQENDEQ